MPRGILVVRSRPVSPEREDEYNAWYSGVHVTELLQVPGFVSARRFRRVGEGGSDYLAVYEVDADDLAAPLQELRRRSSAGDTTRSDAIQTDPPPEIVLYEALD